jgi:alpha/beta superfamily hydrolase
MGVPERTILQGDAGAIECAVRHHAHPRAVAIVAHPHPLFGGTMDNKVVTTLDRAFYESGATVWRFNFRGVGKSEGIHDEGRGETADLIHVARHAIASDSNTAALPLWLAGFSFGGAVALAASEHLDVTQLVMVAPAFSRLTHWPHATRGGRPPAASLVIHGDKDDTVPMSESLDWARERDQAVSVVPGADHFFHGRLHLVRELAARWVA